MNDQNTRIRIRSYRGGYVGEVDVPASEQSPARIVASAMGSSKAAALGNAALLAERIASDPVLQALMPPQAMAAIAAAKGLAGAAKLGTGALKSFWGKLHGPGKKRVAAALHEEAARAEREDSDVSGPRRMPRRGRRVVRQREPDFELPDDADDAISNTQH